MWRCAFEETSKTSEVLGQTREVSLVNTCVMLAVQADVRRSPLWNPWATAPTQRLATGVLDNGAIQCGYCTPAQLLAAKALSIKLPPSEAEVREAISGVLCRCTGYVKAVQAILNARPSCAARQIIFSHPASRVSSPPCHLTPEINPGGRCANRQRSAATDPNPDRPLTTTLRPYVVASEPQTNVVGSPRRR